MNAFCLAEIFIESIFCGGILALRFGDAVDELTLRYAMPYVYRPTTGDHIVLVGPSRSGSTSSMNESHASTCS